MPTRLFPDLIRPQRIQTFLILFAVVLTLPLVTLGIFATNYMAALDERDTEQRVLQVAGALAENIDRELESAIDGRPFELLRDPRLHVSDLQPMSKDWHTGCATCLLVQ